METNPLLRIWHALPGAVPQRATAAHPRADLPRLRRQLLCMVCFLPALLYLDGHLFGLPLPALLADSPLACGILQLIFCLPILAAGRSIFLSGWTSLRKLYPDGYTLAALACCILPVQGLVLLVRIGLAPDFTTARSLQGQLPFLTLALVLSLLTVSALVDACCRLRALGHLHALLQLPPATTTLVRDGRSLPVATAEVSFGDLFMVRADERFPVDGVVLEGQSSVSEFILTGNRTLVAKLPGAPVYAGTKNRGNTLLCRATAVKPSTALHRMVKLAEKSEADRLPTSSVVAAFTRFFVPIVVVAAFAAVVLWCVADKPFDWALQRGVGILLVASPSVLTMAEPITMLAAACLGIKNGILFSGASGLQAVSHLDTLVLDTTGTLTLGKAQVTEIVPCENVSENFLLSLAAGLEANSLRPTARAVLEKAYAEKLSISPVSTVQETPGCGLRGFVAGKEARGGTITYVGDACYTLPVELEQAGKRMQEAGITPLYYCLAGHAAGILGVAADAVKSTGAYTVAQLQSLGLRVLLLPGKLPCDLQTLVSQTGPDALLTYADSAALGDVLQPLLDAQRHPALVLHAQTEPAPAGCCRLVVGADPSTLPQADLLLLEDNPQNVSAAILLSRSAMRLLRTSHIWAGFYNLLGILMASGLLGMLGVLPGPAVCVALSLLSTPVVWQHTWRCTRALPQIPAPMETEAAGSLRAGEN